MSKINKYIAELINEEVERAFFIKEQEEQVQDQVDPAPAEPAPEPETIEGEDTDVDFDEPGGGAELGGADEGLDDLGDEGKPGDEGGGEGTGDFGGGGFGGGFSGGGLGSFSGDDGEPGLMPDDDEEEGLATTVGPEDVEAPKDPIMSIVDDSIKMLDKTNQPDAILKNIKGYIQTHFDSFEDATPIIKALWDTEDYILRDVAQRLLQFIKGM